MRTAGKIAVTVAIGMVWQLGFSPSWATDISGAGSTFAYPILWKWGDLYKQRTGLSVNYRSVGSGGGIWLIKNRIVDFCMSDASLGPEELDAEDLAQFPIVIGGVVPIFNLSGIGPGQLRLTGSVLARIYLGKIARWNDWAIADLNPGLSLPDQAIIPAHRSNDSGTRYMFLEYLAKISPEWRVTGDVNTSVGYPRASGEKGNDRVANFVLTTNGAIGYVEYTYAKQNNLPYALMRNHDGEFVAPNAQTFQSAVR